eukprot:scaffold5317_cov160-Amphora_coffeaeformis.AAC.20
MARPAEKARAMLNKWVALREKGNQTPAVRHKRPHLASECEFLADAERFRGQIVREIGRLIEKIQNPALGDHEIRETNDEINHKMREKWRKFGLATDWNKRIHELGGVDYNAIERKRQIEEGGSNQRGYQYFGAAKDLPGVKELIAKEENKEQQKKSTRDVYKRISPDYYGWRDEEDGVLLELETIATKKNDQLHKKRRRTEMNDGEAQLPPDYLNVPSQAEISKALLEQRKKALFAKYNL